MSVVAVPPDWLSATLSAGIFLAILFGWAWRNTRRQIEQTLSRRSNLTRDEFLKMMAPDVSREASEFIWESALLCLDYFKQKLTPHPDDHLVDDLPIDDEKWSFDWPRDWSDKIGIHASNLPDWPADWAVTVRNFGRWLDLVSNIQPHPGLDLESRFLQQRAWRQRNLASVAGVTARRGAGMGAGERTFLQ